MQERLYNLNYDISAINGRLTEETRNAIREWQNNTQRPQTGDMTWRSSPFCATSACPPSGVRSPIGDRGASAVVWNRPSRQDAVNAALSDCRGRNKGDECKVVSAADTACGALGFYMAGVRRGAPTPSYARRWGRRRPMALNQCREQARRPDACGVRITFCADGSHQQ